MKKNFFWILFLSMAKIKTFYSKLNCPANRFSFFSPSLKKKAKNEKEEEILFAKEKVLRHQKSFLRVGFSSIRMNTKFPRQYFFRFLPLFFLPLGKKKLS